ncbi:hypothetical protein BD413DRAFT_15379 [Trametes elegans]|nr:hypothetical protein BD413DRAFT_15379 [Trametes elegans]
MRGLDPPFPSFTLVMTQPYDSMRLPTYRESHVLRYHPYPRKHPKTSETLLRRVDHRYDEDCAPRPPPEVADELALTPLQDTREEAALSLDRAMDREDGEGMAAVKRRRSLTSLILDLALAVREGYRNSRAGKRRPATA